MKLKFLSGRKRKNLERETEEVYGVGKLPYLLLETGKKRIRAFSGSLTKEEISKLAGMLRVEIIGFYLLNKKDIEPRINFDAVSLLREKIKKGLVEIDEAQFQKWIRGLDLELEAKRGTVVVRYRADLVGVGKSNGEKIFNYIPKERKVKTPLLS